MRAKFYASKVYFYGYRVINVLGEPSHSIFIVLTGRLRSIKENDALEGHKPSIEIQGEFGQSESVGELEVLLDSPRTSTIHVCLRIFLIIIRPFVTRRLLLCQKHYLTLWHCATLKL